MNNTLVSQMKRNFDEMLKYDIPGQNHTCDLIHTFGHDGGITAGSEETRCVCYAKPKDKTPVFRTSRDYPIFQGMLVYLQDTEEFYLLEETVKLAPDCYQTNATPCNAQITVVVDIPATTDDEGFLIEPERKKELVRNIPCVVKSSPALTHADGGLTISEETKVNLQLNEYTQSIPTEAYFLLDGQTYVVYAKSITGDLERSHGIVTLSCKRVIGGELAKEPLL